MLRRTETPWPFDYPNEGIELSTECLLTHRPLVVRQAHHERTRYLGVNNRKDLAETPRWTDGEQEHRGMMTPGGELDRP